MIETIDVIVRISAATVFSLVALALLRDARREKLTGYFALLVLGACGFLAGNTPYPDLKLTGLAGLFLHVMSGWAAIFFWWFGLALFDDDFRLGRLERAAGFMWFVIALADRGFLMARFSDIGLSWVLITMALALSAHLVWTIIRNHEGDLIDARRHARPMLAAAIVLLLAGDVFIDIVFGLNWKPQGLTLIQNTLILAISLWLSHLILRAEPSALFFQAAKPDPAHTLQKTSDSIAPVEGRPQNTPDQDMIERLRKVIDEDRIHLNADLTFSDFARKVGRSQADVRRFINHHLGYRHFRSFLNDKRIQEARRLLADPARADEKIASIAFDSGFASLASFHRAFNALEGHPPSAYRERFLDRGQTAEKKALTPVQPGFEK